MLTLLLLAAGLLPAQHRGTTFPNTSTGWILGVVRTKAGDPIVHVMITVRFDRPSDLGGSEMSLRETYTRRDGTFTQQIVGEGYFEVCAATPEARQCQTVEVEKSKDTNVSFDF